MRTRSGAVVALSVVVGLLVAVTGVFVVLYLTKHGDSVRAAGEVARTERAIDERQDRLAGIESTVEELDSEHGRLESDNRKLHACADPARDAVAAARAGDRAAIEAALDDIVQNCER